MAGAFNLKMAVEMFDAADDFLTLRHIRAGPQSNGIAFLPGLEASVRLVGIAPGGNSVYECFELAGNVCPIRRCDRDDDICKIKFIHDIPDNQGVRHHALRGLVA